MERSTVDSPGPPRTFQDRRVVANEVRNVVRPFPIFLAAILAVTAIPLGLRYPSLRFVYLRWNWDDIVQNTLLYIPFGLAFPGTLRTAVLVALAVSTGVELDQWISLSRYPGFLDIASNVLGAGLGGLGALALRRESGGFRSFPVRAWMGWAALFAGGLFVTALVLRDFPGNLPLWQSGCSLTFDEESGGNRHWQGNILAAQLVGAAVPPALIRTIAKEGAGSLSAHFPAPRIFELNGPFTTHERTRFLATDYGMGLDQLSMLLWIRNSDAVQQQANIVSYACAPYVHFRVSQIGKELAFQMQTPSLAPEQTEQEIKATVFRDADRDAFVALVYDRRSLSIYLNGKESAAADFGALSVGGLALAYGASAAFSLAWILLGSTWVGRMMTLILAASLSLLILELGTSIHPGQSLSLSLALALGVWAAKNAVRSRSPERQEFRLT